jgi:hypothetical protein
VKALILNGERAGEDVLAPAGEAIAGALEGGGWQAQTVALRDVRVARCTGCFGCWVRTPGLCVLEDFGRDLARMAAESDLMVFLTRVVYGGYSPELKKAVDRFACSLLLPFFMTTKGRVRHRPRYRRLPRLAGVGFLPRPDGESEEIFRALVEGNAANLHSPAWASAFLYGGQDAELIREKMRELLREVGA